MDLEVAFYASRSAHAPRRFGSAVVPVPPGRAEGSLVNLAGQFWMRCDGALWEPAASAKGWSESEDEADILRATALLGLRRDAEVHRTASNQTRESLRIFREPDCDHDGTEEAERLRDVARRHFRFADGLLWMRSPGPVAAIVIGSRRGEGHGPTVAVKVRSGVKVMRDHSSRTMMFPLRYVDAAIAAARAAGSEAFDPDAGRELRDAAVSAFAPDETPDVGHAAKWSFAGHTLQTGCFASLREVPRDAAMALLAIRRAFRERLGGDPFLVASAPVGSDADPFDWLERDLSLDLDRELAVAHEEIGRVPPDPYGHGIRQARHAVERAIYFAPPDLDETDEMALAGGGAP